MIEVNNLPPLVIKVLEEEGALQKFRRNCGTVKGVTYSETAKPEDWIHSGFNWEASPEGKDYWYDMFNKMRGRGND